MIGPQGRKGPPHSWCGILYRHPRSRIHEGRGPAPLLHPGGLGAVPSQGDAQGFCGGVGADHLGKTLLEGWARAGGGGKLRCRGQELPFEAQQRTADREGKDGEASDDSTAQVEPKERRA